MLKPDTADWLRAALREGQLSWTAVARQLCERDGWRNQQGELCAASAGKGLPRLAAQLGLPLPPARHAAGGCRLRSRCQPRQALPPLRRHFGDLLAAEHPLGHRLAPGCRLVYGVRAGGRDVGVVSFVAAPMRLRPRDRHLGWDERTRRRNPPKLVSLDRFLVRPGVVVRNLASRVLGQALRRLGRDGRVPGAGGSEYERAGTAALFLFSEPLAGWRAVSARERRTQPDWAEEVAALLEGRSAHCERVTLVLDNLHTHTPEAFYEALDFVTPGNRGRTPAFSRLLR